MREIISAVEAAQLVKTFCILDNILFQLDTDIKERAAEGFTWTVRCFSLKEITAVQKLKLCDQLEALGYKTMFNPDYGQNALYIEW